MEGEEIGSKICHKNFSQFFFSVVIERRDAQTNDVRRRCRRNSTLFYADGGFGGLK